MPATKLAFNSLPVTALATPNFLAGQEADDLENDIASKIRDRARLRFEQSGSAPGNDDANWLQAEAEILRSSMEVRESGTWLSLRASIPDDYGQGMRIVVRPTRVLVCATRPPNEQHAKRDEDELFIVANLSVEVDPASAAASFRDHHLQLMIRKTQPIKTSTI